MTTIRITMTITITILVITTTLPPSISGKDTAVVDSELSKYMAAEMIAQLPTSTVVVVVVAAETETETKTETETETEIKFIIIIIIIVVIMSSSISSNLVIVNKNIIEAQTIKIDDSNDLMMIVITGDNDTTEQLHHAFELLYFIFCW